MNAHQITISLPQDLVHYVDAVPDPSALITKALQYYREREHELELARAYREDAEESRRRHQEWAPADAEFPE